MMVVVPPQAGCSVPVSKVSQVGAAEGHLHMGMRIDPAGDDVLPRRVDHLVDGGLEIVHAEGGGPRREQRGDLLAVDEDIGLGAAGRRNNRPARDERRCHELLSPSFLRQGAVIRP